ncbi:MAG: RNA polymerase sigma factor [Phycisphaerae bacterium]
MQPRQPLAELIGRAQRHDARAFEELVDRFGQPLFGLLFRLTGSRHEAEDLLQELFLRVVQTIQTYQHDGRFEAWLFRIAINLARDRARKIRRRPATLRPGQLTDWVSLDARPGPDQPPDQLSQHAERLDRLQQALAALSPPQREVIMLRHFSGLSFKDIAEIMGTPIGTALARAHRALAHLRRLLQDHHSQ